MLKISEQANKNYLARVIQLKNIQKHPGADRLQMVTVDFLTVITGMDAKDGDLYIYFPLETTLNLDFLSFTNSFRHTNLNKDQDDNKPGFFEDAGRVKATKLRGERSSGYLVPAEKLWEWAGVPYNVKDFEIGQEFDTIDCVRYPNTIVCKKYVIKSREYNPMTGKGKKPKRSRLIDNQIRLHCDTENLRKEVWKIKPEDIITITYKLHGTSGWTAHVPVKKNLSLLERALKFVGVNIIDTEYDYVFGSRKVVKNSDMQEGREPVHFYGYDLWGEAKENLKEFIPKGYSLYYEIVGNLKGGGPIQPGYDYGCKDGEHKIYVYRITFTNADGLCNDLSSMQVKQYCEHFGLNYVPTFYHGRAGDIDMGMDENLHCHEQFIKLLEDKYNDKPCFMCVSKNPEEGIVLRKESLFNFDAWKLKSFSFLEFESKQLDSGEDNLEDNQ